MVHLKIDGILHRMKYGEKILATLGKLFILLQLISLVCNDLFWGDETKCGLGSEEFPREHIQSPHQQKGKMSHPEGVEVWVLSVIWSETHSIE